MSLIEEFRKMENQVFQDELNLPGWTYYDLPRMSKKFFQKFCELTGHDNLHWITTSTYGEGSMRGQVMISPEGMNRIREYNKNELSSSK